MKIFIIILMATVACSNAEISGNQGYNYQQQQQQQSYGLGNSLQQHQPLLMNIFNNQLAQQQNSFQLLGNAHNRYLAPAPAPAPASIQTHTESVNMAYPMPAGFPAVPNFQLPKTTHRRPRPRVKITKKPIVTKNFFIHSAPEESEDEIQEELAQLAQQPRKHYNVLFVKTPAQTSKAAALNLAKAIKEEKTVVYVLSKKTSAADLQDAIAQAPQHINKPDVFFIKYRTPEEAANAQRQIQTQYDSLGGSSTITDEGIAPITSVVGSLDPPEEDEIDDEQLEQEQHHQQQQQQQQQQQGSQQYGDQQLVNSINSIHIGSSSSGGNTNQYLPPNQY